MSIGTLIDKQDNAEIVRDQIAALLALEVADQMTLASDQSLDPELWRLRIFQERANPWEVFPEYKNDESPIVNVWWDSADYDKSQSNVMERQKARASYNVDCYAYGQSRDDPSGGHTPGDREAAETVQRAVRLVRNILMADVYAYLGLPRGLVWSRWINSVTIYQPQQDNQNVHHVTGARMSLEVEFNEFSPQYEAPALELLSAQVLRADSGQILIEADYDYT